MIRSRLAAAGLLVLGSAGCAAMGASPAPGPTPLPLEDRLDALISESPFDRVHWGVLFIDAASGRTLYERNPDLLFIPGSNMKVPVVAGALGLLGPEYRWQTTFYSRVLPSSGLLDGDLYLAAQGDPTLGEPFHESSERALAALADSLVAAGVEEVSGRLIVDVSAWDSTTVPESWMMEDLDVSPGATGGAFSVDRGILTLRIQGGDASGQPATVSWSPEGLASEAGSSPFVEHRVRTVTPGEDSQIRTSFLPESRRWIVEGTIAVGEERTISRSSRDPIRLAVSALARALSEGGVRIVGGTEIAWEPGAPVETACATARVPSCAEMLRVTGLPSPPLIEVAAAILQPSQNWITEQLVRTLGAELGTQGSWAEGFRVLEGFLETEVGVSPEDMHWEDGSGMSNHNLISPRAVTSILRHARAQPWGPAFRASLAHGGQEESTLSSRLEELGTGVSAKTGTLNHVNTISGYVFDAAGRELVFSILTNGSNLPAGEVRARADALILELAGR